MTEVKVKFRSVEFGLQSDDADRLYDLSMRYEARANEVAASFDKAVSDIKIAVITGILLEDKIEEALNANINSFYPNQEVEDLKSEISRLQANFAQTIGQICNYMDSLSEQIIKRYS